MFVCARARVCVCVRAHARVLARVYVCVWLASQQRTSGAVRVLSTVVDIHVYLIFKNIFLLHFVFFGCLIA